jgi:hypothetical protein
LNGESGAEGQTGNQNKNRFGRCLHCNFLIKADFSGEWLYCRLIGGSASDVDIDSIKHLMISGR